MWVCWFAAFLLLIAAFLAPHAVGAWLAGAAILAFLIGAFIGAVMQRWRP